MVPLTVLVDGQKAFIRPDGSTRLGATARDISMSATALVKAGICSGSPLDFNLIDHSIQSSVRTVLVQAGP